MSSCPRCEHRPSLFGPGLPLPLGVGSLGKGCGRARDNAWGPDETASASARRSRRHTTPARYDGSGDTPAQALSSEGKLNWTVGPIRVAGAPAIGAPFFCHNIIHKSLTVVQCQLRLWGRPSRQRGHLHSVHLHASPHFCVFGLSLGKSASMFTLTRVRQLKVLAFYLVFLRGNLDRILNLKNQILDLLLGWELSTWPPLHGRDSTFRIAGVALGTGGRHQEYSFWVNYFGHAGFVFSGGFLHLSWAHPLRQDRFEATFSFTVNQGCLRPFFCISVSFDVQQNGRLIVKFLVKIRILTFRWLPWLNHI